MRMLIASIAGAALLAGTALAQPTSPVPGSQPGTKSPGADLPKKDDDVGSGSAPIGPPATPANPSTPGASSVPGAPSTPSTPKGSETAPEATKKLDTPAK
jgi:hypothetical protein